MNKELHHLSHLSTEIVSKLCSIVSSDKLYGNVNFKVPAKLSLQELMQIKSHVIGTMKGHKTVVYIFNVDSIDVDSIDGESVSLNIHWKKVELVTQPVPNASPLLK
jgi:hypothetical protein